MLQPLADADLDRSIVDRFDAVVAACHDRTAIRTPRASIDYASLKAHSERIAALVHAHGGDAARTDALAVVTLLPQGIDAIAAQLGSLRAGAFYVPLAPDPSSDALRALVRRVGAAVVLGDARTAVQARPALAPHAAVIDVATAGTAGPGRALMPTATADHRAYVYFTSGSTGMPKGVVDCHRNVLHNILRYTRALALGPEDRLTLLQPPSFSGAVSSTYAALLNGATLLLYDLHADGPVGLAPFLDATGVTVYHSVPSIFRNFVAGRARYASMRYIRLEGDRALGRDARLFQQHFGPGCRLVNGLGTTETGLVRQYFVDHDTLVDDGPLPIGYPVEGVECLVADADGAPCATGEAGEIVVVGRHLALGYWGDQALTQRKFADDARGRRYRTGDRGRMRADGCLEHLGRVEAEARIRGVTVDRTVVEQALLQVTGVLDAAVVEADSDGEPVLVAAVASAADHGLSPAKLRAALAREVPERAMPSRFVVGEALPLTPFGKVDRAAIARAARAAPEASSDAGCRDDAVERQVAAIWTSVLDVPSVDAGVPFLDQGGDSLRALQILVRVHDAFGVQLSPATFFALPTVAEQARAVRAALARRTDASRT